MQYEWHKLDLACKSVILIGIFLLTQLICAVFIPVLSSQPTINAIFQTSLSSIFGYILGMNIPNASKSSAEKICPCEEKDSPHHLLKGTNIHIFFTAGVCLVCLITLTIYTVIGEEVYNDGIVQIGHLVSTTIGFLISSSSKSPWRSSRCESFFSPNGSNSSALNFSPWYLRVLIRLGITSEETFIEI